MTAHEDVESRTFFRDRPFRNLCLRSPYRRDNFSRNSLKNSMRRCFPLLVPLLCFALPGFSQTFTLSGTVLDASTGEPLVAANIRVSGTTKGTISNSQGVYRLALEHGRHTILFSFLGYKMDTLHVNLERNTEHHVRLQPFPIQLSEIVVTAEDPAYYIMRKVIENKKRWADSLKSYQFDAFTRQVIRRDTAIATIMESYSTGYWQVGDTLREVVRQKRQTENIPGSANFVSVGGVLNFYQDEIRFAGFRFVGPTAPDAFDYYEFKLEKTRDRGGVPLYTILAAPRTRLVPLFRGSLNVIGDTYALVGVDVSPNEALSFPFLSTFEFRYAQQFDLYENIYWMPVDIRVKGWAEIGMMGLSFPKLGFDQVSSVYEYRINVQIPDSVFKKPRRVVLAEADKFDSLFWAQREVLPLTPEEQGAYKTLDSTQSLDKQFQPSGPLSLLGSPLLWYIERVDLRFNRIEGLFFGLNHDLDSLTNRIRLFGSGGYGFSDKKSKLSLGGEFFPDSLRRYSLGFEIYKSLEPIPDERFYNSAAITAGALLDKSDYRDYFYSRGWRIFLRTRPMAKLSLRFDYMKEDHRSAIQRTNYSFFSRSDLYRPNPIITEGSLRALKISARYGESAVPLGLIARDFAELELEHSLQSSPGGGFNYTRFAFRGELHLQTYSRRFLFPPLLSVHLSAGTSRGSLPPQRLFSLESRYSGYAPFGVLRSGGVKEFSGNKMVLLSIEHNFRSTPFLALNIPFLYKNSVELVLHGTAARTWGPTSTTFPVSQRTVGWFTEAGFGINRLFSFFRLDYTYRFARPRNSFVSLGIARLL